MTRILSDYFGRDIVRSNQKSVNLRTHSGTKDMTATEAIKTNKNINMSAACILSLVYRINEFVATDCKNETSKIRMEYDDRDKNNIRIESKNAAYLSAVRPMQDTRFPELAYLSLYEFVRYCRIESTAYVISGKDIVNEEDACYPARLTESGCEKVAARKDPNILFFKEVKIVRLKKKETNHGCLSQTFLIFIFLFLCFKIRQFWILVRNERPNIPSFCTASMPDRKNGKEERHTRIVMTYFHPFTLQQDLTNPDVPHVSRLRGEEETWEKSLLVWLEGNVFIHEVRNMIQNFFFVARMGSDFIPDANKNYEDIFSDEDIDRERTDVQTLLYTHCGVTRDDNQDDHREGKTKKMTHEHSKDVIRRFNRMWIECETKGRKMEGVKLTHDNSGKCSDDEMKQLKRPTLS